jgi:hypothetical protein
MLLLLHRRPQVHFWEIAQVQPVIMILLPIELKPPTGQPTEWTGVG